MLRPIRIRGPLAALALASLAVAAAADVTIVDAAQSPVVRYARSHALLIGVSDYTAGWDDLGSVPGELETLRTALESHGFTVETVLDPGEDALRAAVEDFIDRHGYREDNRLLIFFAGHGHTRTVGGTRRGYLVPADAPVPTSGRVQAFLKKSVPMTHVLGWARQIEARHALFVFDACFSGTLFDTRSELPEPAHITTLTGRPVRQFLTAGRAGETVPSRSVFTPALVRALGGAADLTRDGYVTGTELGVYLHQEVAGSGQTPQYGKLPDPGFREGDFVFRLPHEVAPDDVDFDLAEIEGRLDLEAGWIKYQSRMTEAYRQVEALEEREGTAATKAAAWTQFLASFERDNPYTTEDDDLRRQAGERQAHWRGRPVSPPRSAERVPVIYRPGNSRTEPALGMKFRYIPGGTFQMGSPATEPGRDDDEQLHHVTLGRGFWMGETEVTQAQWKSLMGNNPSRFSSCGDDCPVEQVSWYEAVAFANALSKKAGHEPCYEVSGGNGKKAGEGLEYDEVRFRGLDCRGYRLPTEAEWERAARAETTTPFSTGESLTAAQANFGQGKPVLVRSFDPNPWGLYEIHGNVYEWVWDRYGPYPEENVSDSLGAQTGSNRVMRGGGWNSYARYCRSAYRYGRPPGFRDYNLGFRLVRTP